MTTSTDNADKKTRPAGFRRWLRFSLRGLLLLFVAVSLGLWYWWYVPFEVEVVIDSKSNSPPPAHLDQWADKERRGGNPNVSFLDESFDPFWIDLRDPFVDNLYFRRELRTVRRKAFSGTLRYGPTLVFNQSGQKIFEENWRDDRLDGPYKMWNGEGQLIVSGGFLRGKKHGNWRFWNADGRLFEERAYAQGEPDGLWTLYGRSLAGRKLNESRYRQGEVVETTWFEYADDPLSVHNWAVEYRDGKPVRLNGEPLREFSQRLIEAPQWAQALLERPKLRNVQDVTLEEFVDSIGQLETYRFGFVRSPYVSVPIYSSAESIPRRINVRALKSSGIDLDRRFSLEVEEIPLSVGLQIVMRKLGLVCDFRFDELVITTKEDAANWTDRTGIDQLALRPGHPWSRRLYEETTLEPVDVAAFRDETWESTAGAVIRLDPRLVDLEARPGFTYYVVHSTPMPFHFWLHRLLGREGLTCELNGNTLLIKSQKTDRQ